MQHRADACGGGKGGKIGKEVSADDQSCGDGGIAFFTGGLFAGTGLVAGYGGRANAMMMGCSWNWGGGERGGLGVEGFAYPFAVFRDVQVLPTST